MSSTVPESARVWRYCVAEKVTGKNGNIEPMREFLPTATGEILTPTLLYRMYDRTPHENLPMKKTTIGQFFKVTTSEVPFW